MRREEISVDDDLFSQRRFLGVGALILFGVWAVVAGATFGVLAGPAEACPAGDGGCRQGLVLWSAALGLIAAGVSGVLGARVTAADHRGLRRSGVMIAAVLGVWIISLASFAAAQRRDVDATPLTAGPAVSDTTTAAPATTFAITTTAPPLVTATPAPTTGPPPTFVSPSDLTLIAGWTCFLGGVTDTGWVPAEAIDPATVEPGEYRVIRVGADSITAAGSALARPDEICPPTVILDPDIRAASVAVSDRSSPPFLPRPIEIMPLDHAPYLEATQAVLNELGADSLVEVAEVAAYRFDVEGDGIDEAIVTSTSVDHVLGPGGYSVAFLRRYNPQTEQVETTVLGHFLSTPDASFFSMAEFEVAAIADIDGDGVMEITLEVGVWEGQVTEVWGFDSRGEPVLRLSCSCGL